MHTPRHIQTSIELSELVAVPHQIVSAQSNKPVIGCIQDNLLGCMKITQDSVVISREDLLDILGYIHNDLPDIPYKEEYTGKEVFSFFIPHNLNYTNGDVIISNGELVQGELSKKHMGTAGGGLIHVIWNDFGAHETVKFMDNTSVLVNRWLMTQGFSVGLSDAIVDIKTKREINTIIEDTKLKVYQEIAKVDNGTAEASGTAVFEHDVLNILNATRDNVGSLATKNVFHNNRIKDMVTAGSKGSPLNISQIMGLVGQQVVKNADGTMGRVADGFTDRPFPHVPKYTLEPSARGFVGNSYLTGLEPLEWFCHSMSGREGLIDTAIKTAETGYLQRKLMKSMEDVKIGIGNYVQTFNGQIIQFLYGGDSMDATYLEKHLINSSPEDYIITNPGDYFTKATLVDQTSELELLKTFLPASHEIFLPFNLPRLLNNTFKPRNNKAKTALTYEFLYNSLIETINSLKINGMLVMLRDQYIKSITQGLLTFCAPKILVSKYSFTKKEYLQFLQTIKDKYLRGIVDPGECVGPLAAQAIGESLTQMTLNTFHSAGIASQTQITAGIPRFRELINVSKAPQNSTITMELKNNTLLPHIDLLSEHLKYSVLTDFVERVDIHYDSTSSVVPADNFYDESVGESPWVLVLTLNDTSLVSKRVYLNEIIDTISSYTTQRKVIVSASHDNAEKLKVFIRPEIHALENQETLHTIANDLQKIWICGNLSIENTFITPENTIIASGGYLEDILALPFINPYNTISNNISNTFETLGMEATRELLFQEIQKLLSDNGIYINSRHTELLVDTIAHGSILISMDRHGVRKGDASVLSASSFEETVDQLAKASVFSQQDNLLGVTPAIMLGQIANIGTCMNDIVYIPPKK